MSPTTNSTKGVRERTKPYTIRVTLPDKRILCFKRAVDTFLETLRTLSPEQLSPINLVRRHLPLVSRECYAIFGKDMKLIKDGWYVNTQSDTTEKYLELRSIVEQLNLDYIVEIGYDFVPTSGSRPRGPRKPKTNFSVDLPDGTLIHGDNARETYLEVIRTIGPEKLFYRNASFLGREIITRHLKFPNQEELEKGVWVTVPTTTDEKMKALEAIKKKLGIEFEMEKD